MSNRPSTSQPPAPASSRDWSQATDADLEVHTSNSEGTERAKEAEKSQQEAAKKERRAEARRQKAEEACLEWERKEREEHERQEALAAARQAAVAEAEAARQSVAKEKGHVGELQSESRGSSVGSSGQVAAYSPTTGASMGTLQVAPTVRHAACDGCKQRGEAEEVEVEAAASGSRKWAGTGGSRGSGRKKGRTDEEDDDDDDEIEEVPGPVTSCPEASGSGPAREGSEFGRLGQGVPGPLYDEHMLVIQARQVAAMERQALTMERMAGAMEAQAVAVHVYVQRQPVFPPWPPGGLAGVAPGASQAVVGESGSSSRESGVAPARGEAAVGGGVRESGEEGDQDAEGDAEGMQE
ncbi:hypothetical protein EDD16DRAFT_1712513 [Pisolithus croceorrhizus]|nr:hypothetical protein EDD16DRAFT_1712513 [Pisolithus croceorrhizus]